MKQKVKLGGRRQFLAPQELWDQVADLARLEFTSVSGIIRQALVEYLNKKRTS